MSPDRSRLVFRLSVQSEACQADFQKSYTFSTLIWTSFALFLIYSQEVDCAEEILQSHVSSAVKRLHNAMAPCHAWHRFFCAFQDLIEFTYPQRPPKLEDKLSTCHMTEIDLLKLRYRDQLKAQYFTRSLRLLCVCIFICIGSLLMPFSWIFHLITITRVLD